MSCRELDRLFWRVRLLSLMCMGEFNILPVILELRP